MESSAFENEQALIIDKKGIIGEDLAKKLIESPNYSVVLVSSKSLPEDADFEKIIFVPFVKRVPLMPQAEYSKIVIVYNGEREILEILPQFSKEAEKLNARFILVTPCDFISQSFIKKIEGLEGACLILLGELFGGSQGGQNTNLDSFLHQVKAKEKIDIPGMGMEKMYPIFWEDAISAISEVVFKKRLIPQNFYLFPRHLPSKLSFTRILKKIEPNLKIDFIKNNLEKQKDFILPKGEYILEDSYPLEKRIRQAFESIKIDREGRANKKEKDQKQKINSQKLGLFFFLFILIVLSLPIICTLFFSFLGIFQLKATKNLIEKGNFSQGKNSAQASNMFFSLAQESGRAVVLEGLAIGQEGTALRLTKNIMIGKEIAQAAVNILISFDNFIKVSMGKTNTPKKDFIAASNLLKNTITAFQKIRTEENVFFGKDILTKDNENLTQMVSGVIDVFPDIFGFEGSRKYLILFQNNMELRPGGGFIGSYGLLSLQNARVKDFSIDDVYDADGQLKGHIEPPFAIRRYMPLVHWYFRDSNFNVDFTKNASNAAFFLNQETGEQVNGVIAVDLSFVKNLLQVLGPVKVSDYNETVTSDNLYLLTQKHAEKNFFSGSTQKKDFLRSLFNSTKQNLLTKKDLPYFAIAKIVGESILQKHLLLAFGNSSIQTIFTVNGMSSSLWDDRKEAQESINDFLGVNEANLGVNKANYFIKRKISQEVLIDKERNISENLTILYKNNSDKWPGGDYKNYLHLVLPLRTRIQSVSIDDKEQELVQAVTDFNVYEDKNFKPPTGLEIEESEENGKTIFGFLVIIPQNALKKVSVSYLLPNEDFLDLPSFYYSHRVFKQPGTEDDPYSFSLSYPKDLLKVFDQSKDLKAGENNVSYSSTFSQDLNFQIKFSKR